VRTNGLTASAYTPVADIDPRLADALLDELRERGIAAYAEPIATSSMTGLAQPEFVNVHERLYVASTGTREVRELLAAHDKELVDAENDDLSWAQIVADFDQPVATDRRVWPSDEEIVEATTAPTLMDSALDDPASDPDAPDERDRERGTRRDADDHYVPPPPPPLPSLDPVTQLSWVGTIGGPVLMLVSVLFGLSLPPFVVGLAIVGFVGGFVTLVARMTSRDIDDDPDNGAIV
jgi:hypothetical protein